MYKNQSVTLAGMNLAIKFVTPDYAREILINHNGFNRRMKPQLVSRLSHDMQEGNWSTMTAEFIKFDQDGTLIDGQNRLMGIVESNVGQWMLIAKGLPTSAREVIDQGVRRNGADVLTFHDNPNCAKGILASMLRAIGAWETGWLINAGQKTSRYNISNSDLLKIYDQHRDAAVDAVNWSGSVPKYMRCIPRSVLAFTYFVTRGVDPEAAEGFWEGVVNQQTDGPGDPRLAMMAMFSAISNYTGQDDRPAAGKVTGIYAYGVFEAWNLWREGQTLRSMRHTAVKRHKDDPITYRPIPVPR